MDRRRFALSWGRKIFFGLGWPLLCLLSLVFLKSGVIPKDFTSILYYVLTTIAYYGLVTSLIYFVGFVPIASLFPTYYIVRLWSAFLILASGAAVMLNGMVFSEYRFHINKLILTIFALKGPAQIFNGSKAPFIVIAGVIVFLFFLLWIRGEILWRIMQRRFSNPVKNWYFILIVLCLGLSHLLWGQQRAGFYGNEITLASLFPFNYQEKFFPKDYSSTVSQRNFSYPKKELRCHPKSLPNLILIVMENFRTQSLNPDETPFMIHLQEHGMNFRNHVSGGGSVDDNLYHLIFGMPASYRTQAFEPVLISELRKHGYELTAFSQKQVPGLPSNNQSWKTWASTLGNKEAVPPQFIFINISASTSSEADQKLAETFQNITSSKLLGGSTIIITGTDTSEWETVPMTMILPVRIRGNWEHRTTHYDLAPTVMGRVFDCKAPFATYSYGKGLTEAPGRDWEIFGNENNFRIVDFTNRNIIQSDWHGRIYSGESARNELVLKAAREISRFYR